MPPSGSQLVIGASQGQQSEMLLGGKATERGPSPCWLPVRQVRHGREAIASTSAWDLCAEPGVGRQQTGQGGSEKREWSAPVCQALCWASVTGCRGAWGPGISPARPLTLMAL